MYLNTLAIRMSSLLTKFEGGQIGVVWWGLDSVSFNVVMNTNMLSEYTFSIIKS